ncbi:MAG: NADPH-dependent assimilatory sulfite reductase hemoprotein subunit [Pseudomonadota bacterium]
MTGLKSLTDVERIKSESNLLRGTLAESLVDPLTGAIAADDTQLSKFHGIYQQDDRDLRSERRKQLLEPAYSFMIRARIPGGKISPAQWLALDTIATTYANNSLRATTRQAFQYHGVVKRDLKTTMQAINESLLDTLAACGDVNRNVMASANPAVSSLHAEIQDAANRLSEHLCPKTGAYHEIWLDSKKLESSTAEHEPIYGKTYLPRKFKAAFVNPPDNDVDIYSQDLGFIAIEENGKLAGFNVAVGGGMGMSHAEPETYPRLASVIGFCKPEAILEVAEAVVTVQRDYGDRSNRKHARLKYTIDSQGLDWFKNEVADRLQIPLAPARDILFTHTGDRFGWQQAQDLRWHLGLFVENGRIADLESAQLLSFFRAAAARNRGYFILTPNQNVIIADLDDDDRLSLDKLMLEYGIDQQQKVSALRQNSMACVGFPTCGLAMAESERYLPQLVGRIEALLANYGLQDVPIVTRMTGCPNGCARPYVAEIGLVGKGPGRYKLYLGAAHAGDRLSRLYLDNANEAMLLDALDPLLKAFSVDRQDGESFGNFLVRENHLQSPTAAEDFHEYAV